MIRKTEKVDARDKFQWLNVITITIAHHIHDIYTAFLPALQSIIKEAFSLDYKMLGLLSVAQRIPTLLNPFIGIMAEKVRIRYLMIATPTITAIAMSLMGNMPDFKSLIILVAVSGISSSIFHVPTPVMMRHVSGKKPGVGMGFYMFGGQFARSVGPIIAISAAGYWGFSGMYRLIPIGLASSLLLFLRFRKTDLRKEFKKIDKKEGNHLNVLNRYKAILIMIALVTLVWGGMKSIFVYYLISFLKDMGWEDANAAKALSLVYLTATAGSLVAGWASDHIGKKPTLLLSFIITSLLIFAYLYDLIEMSYFLIGVIGFFLLASTPVFLSEVNSIKSKHVTFLNGVYMTGNFLMSALSTMLAGAGMDSWGSITTLKIMTFVSLLAIPLVIFMPLKTKK